MIPILFSEVRRYLLWPWERKRMFQSRTTLTVRKCSRGFNLMLSSKLSGKEGPCSSWSDVTLEILAFPWQLYLEGKFYEADFFSWFQTTQTTWLLLTTKFSKNLNPKLKLRKGELFSWGHTASLGKSWDWLPGHCSWSHSEYLLPGTWTSLAPPWNLTTRPVHGQQSHEVTGVCLGKSPFHRRLLPPLKSSLPPNYYCLEKCWAGWSTSWNQDCREKYQQPQICRWHHPYGRKQRTKELLDESERVEWKSWLKIQHSKN